MEKWTIYHNPNCSKSREALRLLEENGIKPIIVDYQKNGLTEQEIQNLISMVADAPASLIRTNEDEYQNRTFDVNSSEEVCRHLKQWPILLQRPIVIKNGSAIIARPPELLESLLSK